MDDFSYRDICTWNLEPETPGEEIRKLQGMIEYTHEVFHRSGIGVTIIRDRLQETIDRINTGDEFGNNLFPGNPSQVNELKKELRIICSLMVRVEEFNGNAISVNNILINTGLGCFNHNGSQDIHTESKKEVHEPPESLGHPLPPPPPPPFPKGETSDE